MLLEAFEEAHGDAARWVPVGSRENNRGIIEASSDPGRSLVERLTNGIDAVLEAEHDGHNGHPDCRLPEEAAVAWLGVPEGGLERDGARGAAAAWRSACDHDRCREAGREKRLVEVRDCGHRAHGRADAGDHPEPEREQQGPEASTLPAPTAREDRARLP